MIKKDEIDLIFCSGQEVDGVEWDYKGTSIVSINREEKNKVYSIVFGEVQPGLEIDLNDFETLLKKSLETIKERCE